MPMLQVCICVDDERLNESAKKDLTSVYPTSQVHQTPDFTCFRSSQKDVCRWTMIGLEPNENETMHGSILKALNSGRSED